MLALLRYYSWPELRHHPWRSAAAVVAVMLGVALAFSVHLINASALGEFASGLRQVDGQPDLVLRSTQGGLDESLYARVACHPEVALASPVLELSTLATSAKLADLASLSNLARPGATPTTPTTPESPTPVRPSRLPLRVMGLDPLIAAAFAPELLPRPSPGAERLSMFAPGQVFLNPAARERLGLASGAAGASLALQVGLRLVTVTVAGDVAAAGPPMAVMDIGAAQDLFGRQGTLTRIDLRLAAGVDRDRFRDRLGESLALPAGVLASEPGDTMARIDRLSRAYRVNLTVLALVALFTGAFLVFSVLSLSVARRSQQLALLGVMGLTAAQRLRLVLAESLILGVAGSVCGIALGAGLAALALSVLGGDLGGGYFPGAAPRLQWSGLAAAGYGALGLAAAAAGGWFPAMQARGLPLAAALKGLGSGGSGRRQGLPGLLLIAAAVAMAFAPPLGGIPVAAYLSIALLLVGGITVLPWAVEAVYDRLLPHAADRPLALLAIERARRVRETAAVAVSGVVAALALAVALTVMVASFRSSVMQWLDTVLPADLYLRTAEGGATGDTVFLDPSLALAAARVPGVAAVSTQRVRSLTLDPARPALALIARPLEDASRQLPLVGDLAPPPPAPGPTADGTPAPSPWIPIYVSEAVVDLYGARPGQPFAPLGRALGLTGAEPTAVQSAGPDTAGGAAEGVAGGAVRDTGPRDIQGPFYVAGVWRDYARQSGSIVIDAAAYRALTGDNRVNDLLLWLAPGVQASQVQAALRALPQTGEGGRLLEFASAQDIRATSMRIFDRSFAVTYWLQAVAIGIGLFGVAASFSAQVLARRKEFGLLMHLGLTRSQVLRVVAGEGLAWTAIGAAAGLALGLAVAVVLVHVVNPQSFHWTMELWVPWSRLIALALAVMAAGTLTAWASGRAVAGRDMVLAVKEDW
jgi:putative ABC transport system permease protein